MKYLAKALLSIAFLALAAFLIHKGMDGWGWCMFCAIIIWL